MYKFSQCNFTVTEQLRGEEDNYMFHEIKGYKVTNFPIDYIDVVIHRSPHTPNLRYWVVSELTTGFGIVIPSTSSREDTIDFAVNSIKNAGREKVESAIKEKLESINKFKESNDG